METRQQHIVEIGFDDDFGESEERENQEALPSSDNRTIAPPPGQNRVGPISEDISQVESRFLHLPNTLRLLSLNARLHFH